MEDRAANRRTMSEKKTALMQAIIDLKKYAKSLPENSENHFAVWNCIRTAESFLPTERQQIESAVWHGHDERDRAGMVHIPESMASDYFNETYEQ